MTAGWWLLASLLLSILSSLLAAMVLSLHTLSRVRMAAHLQDQSIKARTDRVTVILDDIPGHAAALAVLRTLARLGTAVCMVFWIGGMRGETTPGLMSITIGLLLASLLLWILSTLIPMGIATHAGEPTVIRLSAIIRIAHALFTPLLPLTRFTDEVVRRLVGADPNARELSISANDLRSIVEDDEVESRLDETERDMLEAVVEFRSTSVEQIMTPRTEINALQYCDDIGLVESFLVEHGHSRIPVYSESLDHIQGMLYAKDLLRWIISNQQQGTPFVLAEILRDPTFVPETKTVRELLAQLLADQVHIAVILDEYGGTSGLVTMEDIVEEIFGEIQDEFEDPEDTPGGVELDLNANAAVIDARTEIDDANDELEGLGIELPESDDYDTVAGYINTILGRIPESGEQFILESLHIEILEAEPTRVVKLRITPSTEDNDTNTGLPEQSRGSQKSSA